MPDTQVLLCSNCGAKNRVQLRPGSHSCAKCHRELPTPVVECANCGVQSRLRGSSAETPRCESCNAYLTGAMRGVVSARGSEYRASGIVDAEIVSERPTRVPERRQTIEPAVVDDSHHRRYSSPASTRRDGSAAKKLLQGTFGLMWMAGALGNALLFLYVEWAFVRENFFQIFNPFLQLEVLLRLLAIPLFWLLLILAGVGYFAMAGVDKTFDEA